MTGTTPERTARRPELLTARDPFDAGARLVADAVARVAEERGRARLAVPGGSGAAAATRAAELLRGRGFDFERLLLTWVDERCVPASSPESNRGTLRLEPAPGVVLPLYLDGERPAEAVRRVERELTTTFERALDVLLLGMGADGHVASLFVGRPPTEGVVAHVRDSPKPPPERITLTRAILGTARHTILVAAGEEKRQALTRLAEGDQGLPASGLPGLVICTDLDIGEPR